ncbi:contactin-5-like [Mya arenaria]|uniref:contactin-5-like n=1 Tax=Mya arenaria TaxID=6604 RepID=UPI0022E81956|nr:contactin-5-like [Mya arenaria]
MYTMWKLSDICCVFVIFILRINGVVSQSLYGCPLGWEFSDGKCYLFVTDAPLFYEEADADCWHRGAALLSVNSYTEHQFISDFLALHDFKLANFFTSGYFFNGVLVWDSDNKVDTSGAAYWVTGNPPARGNPYTRIAYVRGDRTGTGYVMYGWNVVPHSQKSNYICEMTQEDAQNTRIEGRDSTFGLDPIEMRDVEVGPHITDEPGDMLVFEGTPSTYIECKSKGNPNPKYSWLKDGSTEVTSLLSSRYTITGGRMTVSNPDEQKDQGSYQCSVENKFGKILSNPAKLQFGYLQKFSPVPPDDARAKEREGYRISCLQPSYFPEVRFSWFRNGTSEPMFENLPNIFVSNSGYLYFSDVQETDNKKYTCVVTLAASSGMQTSINQPPSIVSLGVWLRVAENEPGNIKPEIYTHTFPSPSVRGATIRVECVAYGTVPIEYSWRRSDGRNFETGTTITDHNRVMTITNAQLSAEGNYICTANGRGGVTNKVITLSMEARPYFPYTIGDKMADPEKTLKWRCKAVARPAATYAWYKDGVLVQGIMGEIEIRRNYLIIHKVDKARDEGMYQCGATNVHGTTFSYGQLKVLRFAPTFARRPIPPTVMLPNGGNFTIRCDVEAAPVPEVRWSKNGGDIATVTGDLSGHVGMTIDYALVFKNIQPSDAGQYTCHASNSEGEASMSTAVSVIEGIVISRPPAATQVMVNRTAFMYCQAGYNNRMFDVTYQWKLNGHILNFTLSDGHYEQRSREDSEGLYIINAQFQHHGEYECLAKTTIHTVSAVATLKVYGPPGPPAGVYIKLGSVTSVSATVVWSVGPAMGHFGDILGYDIEAELSMIRPNRWVNVMADVAEFAAVKDAADLGLREDQRAVVVESLLPDVTYSFRVRAFNVYGRGQEASMPSVRIKTASTIPVVAPRNVRGFDEGKVGTLNIVWDPLDISEYAGPNLGYNVYFKRQGSQKDWKLVKVADPRASMFTTEVGVENYYLEYEVMVGVYNGNGEGPNSTDTVIMSAEGMPIATVLMGDCDNYNGTAFSMSWTPVEDTREKLKGRLKGYRIRYWHIDNPEFVIWFDLYGQHDNTVIIGLMDNSNYWSSVQVVNYAGVGPVGEIRLAETYHLPPQDYPRHVKVMAHSDHSVSVHWQQVMTSWDEETIQGYILRVWKIQEDIRTANDTKVEVVDEAILGGLQKKTVYVLRVLGYSIGGEGSLSPHVYFTVEGEAVPFDPTTTRFCYDHYMCPDGASSTGVSIVTVLLLAAISIVFNSLGR